MDNENNWKTRINLIAFDIDGTLAETDDYYVEKCANNLRKILPFVSGRAAEKITRFFIMAGETLLHEFYRLLDMIGLDSLISRSHSRFSVGDEYRYSEVEGMKNALEQLKQRYSLGVITSGGRKSTEAFLKKFELEELIEFVISSEDCKFIKPHPMPLQKMAEAANVPIQNCLMVGDTIFDVLCAINAGARSAAVRTGFDTGRFLLIHKPDVILDSVGELPEFLMNYFEENAKTDDKTKDLV